MTALPERRRRRTIAAVATGVAAALVLPAGLFVGVTSLLNSTSGDNVGAEDTVAIPPTPAALVVGVNNRNEVVMSAVFALAPGGIGGTIISLPVGANAKKVASSPIHRLADTYATGGVEAYALDVEGTLNVSFSLVQQVSTGDLASMFTALGERTVVLDRPVSDTDGDGETITLVSPGEQVLSPGQMAEALMAAPVGTREAERLPIHKAVWTAIAGTPTVDPTATGGSTVAGGSATTTSLEPSSIVADPTDLLTYFAQMRAGEIRYWQLGSELITDPARNPAGLDLYALDGAEVIMVMASVIPSAVSVSSNNVTFLVDSPFDDVALTREAVLRLAYLGANVILVREIEDAPQAKTVIYFNDDLVRAGLEEYPTYLGPIEFETTDEIIDRVDARIVLGEDFIGFINGESGALPTTTTVAPATSAVG